MQWRVWKILMLALSLSLVAACKESNSQRTLILASYTAPREAFREINQAFEDKWQAETGEKIKIRESYLSSGAQSRAVLDGFAADIVALALASDIDRLVQAKLIRHPWRDFHQNGMLTESVVAFAVRPGNPHQIKDWADLIDKPIALLTPNPKTSGGAQWNVLAAYGAALRGKVKGFSAGPDSARQFLIRLLGKLTAMDKGARESILTFERGLGDVALSYENEIRQGQNHGQKYELIIPRSTILIQNPVAIVDRNVEVHGNRDIAEAYRKYLFSADAQMIFVKHGFRPVNPEVKIKTAQKFSKVEDLFTIDYFGGWQKVMPEFFGAKGIFTEASESVNRSHEDKR